MDGLVLETTFLIDLEREFIRDQPGPAHRAMGEWSDLPLLTTWIVAGELAAGPRINQRSWHEILAPLHILGLDEETAWQYGQAERYLRRQGLLIGTNDLWIAACCIANELPVVTRNTPHFQRVPGLEVKTY